MIVNSLCHFSVYSLDINNQKFPLLLQSLGRRVSYLPRVSVGLRCDVFVARWGFRWAPADPFSLAVGGRWGPDCRPSAQDCPGWWGSPLLCPSSSTPPEELQPARRNLEEMNRNRTDKLSLWVCESGRHFSQEANEKLKNKAFNFLYFWKVKGSQKYWF